MISNHGDAILNFLPSRFFDDLSLNLVVFNTFRILNPQKNYMKKCTLYLIHRNMITSVQIVGRVVKKKIFTRKIIYKMLQRGAEK